MIFHGLRERSDYVNIIYNRGFKRQKYKFFFTSETILLNGATFIIITFAPRNNYLNRRVSHYPCD